MDNFLTHLHAAVNRVEVGLTKASKPNCAWYDGIEHDALKDLRRLLLTACETPAIREILTRETMS